ncbi:MAG: NUDIX hydrolase [Chloroflexi bacterium]|nr:NUDIX hydrolase [Chloroflexota bacterium]
MSPYRIAKSEQIFQGRILKLRVDTVDVGNGKTVKREVVEHPGAIVVAPIDAQGRLVLVRQYRHAAGDWLLELPAGTLDHDEPVEATAQRELQEEIGCAAGRLERIGGFFSAPGFCTEFLHFFIARDLRPQRRPGDDDEEIEVVAMPIAKVKALAREGKVRDAKTLAGLTLLDLWLQKP